MAHTIHEQENEMGRRGRRRTAGNRGDLPKIWNKSRKLPHGGGNTGRRRGTNGRCTGNNTHCTHRYNITTQEDFYRDHSSSTCTRENDGGSRIDDTVVSNNGPYQGNPPSSGKGGNVFLSGSIPP